MSGKNKEISEKFHYFWPQIKNQMIVDILLLIAGLLLILGGANYLTDGSAAVARRFGLSDLIVGLTIVAFGTSAPELTISVVSAVDGSAGMAIGNVVGSNIFNTLLIIGAVAIVRPIKVGAGIMANEIPLVILSAVALLAIGSSQWLDGTAPVVSRTDGILLLLFFAVFMRYIFAQARKTAPQPVGAPAPAGEPEAQSVKKKPLWLSALFIVGGLATLIYGGNLFVDKASAIASALGVSDAVIGLTIVAAGTSLPELATSVTAAVKGNPGIAIGNVIGSNIFNIFMVLGCSATIRPLPFGGITMTDLIVLTASALLFWIFGWFFGHRTITRAEGVVLAGCYVGYIAFLVAGAA